MTAIKKLICANCRKKLLSTDCSIASEQTINKAAAKKLKLIPLSSVIKPEDYYILENMIRDAKKLHKNYALVKGSKGLEFWHSPHSK